MSTTSGADGAHGAANTRNRERTYTGYAKKDLNKEIAKWPKETLALWEKHGVEETDGSYLIDPMKLIS
jgi:hypothetical protein